MPTVLGIPLIGFIQMVIGTGVLLFFLIKFLARPKKNKQGEFIINNVHIIVGDGSESFYQSVYVKKGIITEISDKPIQKKRVQVIDGTGKTLMPGLIDSHIHIQGGFNCKSEEESDVFLNERMPQIFKDNVLPYGITTIKDLDAPKHFIYKLRDKIRSGEILGPELLIVGPNFTDPNGHPSVTLGSNSEWARKEMSIEVTTPEQISAGIKELKEAGVDFLKFTYQGGDYYYFDKKLEITRIDKALMQQIVREGKENGLNSTAHVFYYSDVKELLEAGIYGVEHGILDFDLEPDDEIIKLWKKTGTHFVPTVNAMTYEKDQTRMEHSKHNLKVLHDAGILIAMGTDNMFEQMTGEVEHRELAYYVEAGLTPMDALVMATGNGAKHLGIADRKGLVKTGMEADLILLDENPAENIYNIKLINTVFLKGNVVFSQKGIQSFDIPDYAFPENLSSAEYESVEGNQQRTIIYDSYDDNQTITQITYKDGNKLSEEEFTVKPSLSAVKWHFSRPSNNTEVSAEVVNNNIQLSGTFKEKPQEKSFKINDGLWYQMMDLCLPAFVKSDLDEILFYSIGTGDNPGAMNLGEFAASKAGKEDVTVNGETFSCVKVHLILTMFSWAWTGVFWYDEKTGQLIQNGVKKGKKDHVLWKLKKFNYK